MRAAFPPQFVILNGYPYAGSCLSYTRRYDPIWQIPASLDEIAKWSFRVRSWTVTVTEPVYYDGLGGASRSFMVYSQFDAQDERYACLPVTTVDTADPDGQGGPVYEPIGGSGAYYSGSSPSAVVAIGPSVATSGIANAPTIVRSITPPTAGILYYPVTVTFGLLVSIATSLGGPRTVYPTTITSVGTDYDPYRTGGANKWTESAATCTFCGKRLPLYFPNTGTSPDWTGEDAPGHITITPATYWEYRRSNGTEPLYDSATGMQLVDALPNYPPR